jgi:hypothetical protein
MRSPYCLCVCESPPPPVNFCMPEPIFMKLHMHIIARESISTAYFINPSHHLCVFMCIPLIVAMRRLVKVYLSFHR